MVALCYHGFFVFIGGLLIAVCRPLLIILPQTAETFVPVPVTPLREPGDKEKMLHRLPDRRK